MSQEVRVTVIYKLFEPNNPLQNQRVFAAACERVSQTYYESVTPPRTNSEYIHSDQKALHLVSCLGE